MLVSFLFFYFKRTISALEKGQMEQARILQTFISNVDMSRGSIPYQQFGQTPQMSTNIPFQQHGGIDHEAPIDDLIHVSDGEDSDDEDSDDEDSDAEDSDAEDSEDEDSDAEDSDDEDGQSNTITTENAISSNEVIDLDSEVIDLDTTNVNHSLNENIVKVIQLDNNTNLEEMIDSSLQDLEQIMDDDNVSDTYSDSDSDDSESEEPEKEDMKNTNDIHLHNNKDIDASNHELPIMDFKSLSVKVLRQMALDRKLSTEEDKLNKKELVKLLETSNK